MKSPLGNIISMVAFLMDHFRQREALGTRKMGLLLGKIQIKTLVEEKARKKNEEVESLNLSDIKRIGKGSTVIQIMGS